MTTEGGTKTRRILIVDDSEMTIALLEAELVGKGFEVMTAQSAETATSLLLKKGSRPDLVLLDIRMPNIDGEQFCRFLKKNEQFQGIKVVLCSGMEHAQLQEIANRCGADGAVCKDQFIARGVLDAIE